MSNHSDFSSHGYEIIRELGRNREAGRITYLATDLNQKRQVVIKEFRFAIAGSDLYSFGATLICLVTGTRSVDVGKLIDDNYRFEFKKLAPKLKPRFIEWLTKMVEPNLNNRYGNAAVALAALKPIDVVGSASWLETLGHAMKPKIAVPVVGLATLGIFTVSF